MTLSTHKENNELLSNPLEYKSLHPDELLVLFRKFAPHSLKQHEAKLIFHELATYLTKDEEKRIFESWEHMHYDPGEFYSVIHELIYKYANI